MSGQQHTASARARRLRCAVAVWALAAGVAAGCGRQETVDLTARFETAELQHEISRIDFGTAAARDHLSAGWGVDELWGETPIVWALGDHSSVEFFVDTVRPITLAMRCWPLPYTGLPTQTVHIDLNGAPLAALALQEAPADYAVPVPAAALRSGVNRLDFHYAYSRRPIDLDANAPDPRPLAVAWNRLIFDGLADREAPALRHAASGEALALPEGSAISFHFDLASGAELVLDGVAPLAGDGAPQAAGLEVHLERDDGHSQVIRLAVPGVTGAQRWALDGGGVTQLTFRPLPSNDGGAGGLLLTAPRLHVPRPPAPVAERCGDQAIERVEHPPVLVYLIDTLRADHVGCYGYPRPTTPRIDAFARDAVRFERAVAQSAWTKPSVASIFTGLSPRQHGANGRADVMAAVPTLAYVLSTAGYQTAAFVTNSAVAAQFGLDEGFATYHVLEEQPITGDPVPAGSSELVHQGADALARAALAWLDARGSAAPFFLYLHASDPHDPYLPPEPFRMRFAPQANPALGLSSTLHAILAGRRAVSAQEREDMISLYDADIAFVDDQFGAFLDELRARGLYDAALIVLVADHGEAFDEHGRWQHATSLFPEQIHVPLLIKFPHQWRAGRVATDLAQHVDILPTILRYLGLDPPQGISGTNLLPALACPGEARPAAPAYSYLGGSGVGPTLESIIVGDRQLIRYLRADRPHGRAELYDLAADPAETLDIASQRPVEVGYLSALIAPQHRLDALAPALARTPDAAVRERLRVLGYAP